MSHIRSRQHNPARIAAMVAATFSIASSVPNVYAADEVTELPEVSVKSKKEVPFKADTSASQKFTKPLIDTTQTVQVIKKELLREQGVFSLTDALRNTPGITMQLGEGATRQQVILLQCEVLMLPTNYLWMVCATLVPFHAMYIT